MRRGDKKVAFVLAIVIVRYDDNFAPCESRDCCLDTLVATGHGESSTIASRALLEWPRCPLPNLRAMHQVMVGENARHHCLADRHSADPDARIMAAFRDNLGVVAIA